MNMSESFNGHNLSSTVTVYRIRLVDFLGSQKLSTTLNPAETLQWPPDSAMDETIDQQLIKKNNV